MTYANTEEPAPVKNQEPAVWDLVVRDMQERDRMGQERYGVRLQPHNGRDVLKDAYQEALDLVVYLRQTIYERDSSRMNRMQAQVLEMMDALNMPHLMRDGVDLADGHILDAELAAKLILEEADETAEALRAGDVTEAIDGLCDTIVVSFFAACKLGVDLTPFFDEVHRTNMAKKGGEIRADGKRLKPPGWQPPRIAQMLQKLRETGSAVL